MNNFLTEIVLQRLNVPYTRTHLYEYMEHLPLNDSLWVIKKTFEHYNVACYSVKVDDKNKLLECNCPFVAQNSGDFVVVTSVSSKVVTYENAMGHHTQPLGKFLNSWSGVAMLCHADSESGEPDFTAHCKAQNIRNFNAFITFLSAIVLIGLTFMLNSAHSYTSLTGLACSAIGLFFSILLLKKHLNIPSPSAEKLCNIVGHGKCDEKSTQRQTKPRLPGNIDLSELGISFFTTNTLALLLFQSNIESAICMSLTLALLFSFWSIGWQLAHRSWCSLCTMVMITVWVQEATVLFNNTFVFEITSILQFASLICCYWMTLQLTISAVKRFQKEKRQQWEINALQRLKYNKHSWEAILNSNEQSYPVDEDSASTLVFGDRDSQMPRITIVGNPFCAPCARMHYRVQTLIDAGFPIQYIYTYFNPDLAPVNKQIAAAYMRDGQAKTWESLSRWYDRDKSAHPFSPNNALPLDAELESKAIMELQKHDKWIEKSGIKATPTVLVDGKPLPANFAVEDLLYLY